MLYEVRALSADHRIATIVVDASDEEQASTAARERAGRVLSVRPARRVARRARAGNFSLILFAQELLALIEAGLSLVEALESMEEKTTPGGTRDVLAALVRALRGGERFSAALAAQPAFFPPLFVGLVQAAETTSDLPSALARFVDFETRMAAFRGKIVTAAVYPAILLVVGTAVTLFLLGYVVPRFAAVYADSGRQMSLLTGLLLELGRLIHGHMGWVLGALAAALISAVLAWRFARDRVGVAGVLARIPGIRNRAQQYELSRLYLTTGLLLQGGIPLVRALAMAQATVGSRTRTRLTRAGARVAAGEQFSAAMAGEDLADSVALRLFRAGEQAGNLGDMLARTARFYDGEVTRFIERFTRAAEPLLMAAIGIVVGSIVVLLYMPIFELAGSLQ